MHHECQKKKKLRDVGLLSLQLYGKIFHFKISKN